MQIIYIEPDAHVRALVSRAFPSYTGKQFKLAISDSPINCASYWDSGNRSYFAFANLATGETSSTVPAQSAFDRPVAGLDAVSLPDGFACIEHNFSGVRQSITIHIRTSNAAPLLPAQVELSRFENIVLAYAMPQIELRWNPVLSLSRSTQGNGYHANGMGRCQGHAN